MNRRVIGIIVAVLLATIGTFVLVAFVQGAERRALAGERTVEVLVARQEIAKGTDGLAIADLVERELVPAKVRAVGSVDDVTQLEGLVAAVDVVPGEQIVKSRFLQPEEVAARDEVDVPEGQQEVTVALDPDRAVGGQILPGDTVGFFASFAPDAMKYSTHLTLHKLLVTNVQLAATATAAPAATSEDQPDDGPEPAPAGQFLVTLAVDPGEAEKVVFAAEHGTVWLSAQGEAASESDTSIKTPETIYE